MVGGVLTYRLRLQALGQQAHGDLYGQRRAQAFRRIISFEPALENAENHAAFRRSLGPDHG